MLQTQGEIMTVSELISELKNFDGDATVLVDDRNGTLYMPEPCCERLPLDTEYIVSL